MDDVWDGLGPASRGLQVLAHCSLLHRVAFPGLFAPFPQRLGSSSSSGEEEEAGGGVNTGIRPIEKRVTDVFASLAAREARIHNHFFILLYRRIPPRPNAAGSTKMSMIVAAMDLLNQLWHDLDKSNISPNPVQFNHQTDHPDLVEGASWGSYLVDLVFDTLTPWLVRDSSTWMYQPRPHDAESALTDRMLQYRVTLEAGWGQGRLRGA